ncbi:MAG: hypothetical protein V8S99_00235 [Oscillospiraceae bacterium]
MEAVADITAKSPEQVYEERETLRELYEGLGRISEREQTYLLYRHGFTDDVGHTLIGTAIHFHLSESRAKKLEDEAMDNLWLELPWWFSRVTLRRDEGCIYLHFLFRPVGFCFSKILHLCRNPHHKIRHCHEKAFVATLCRTAEYAANLFPRQPEAKV